MIPDGCVVMYLNYYCFSLQVKNKKPRDGATIHALILELGVVTNT
jgi:hypothetical protein